MNSIVKFLCDNMIWIFSGLGTSIIVLFIDFFIKNRIVTSKTTKINQIAKGNNITQIGIQKNYKKNKEIKENE